LKYSIGSVAPSEFADQFVQKQLQQQQQFILQQQEVIWKNIVILFLHENILKKLAKKK